MHTILSNLMTASRHTPYDVYHHTGIQPSTIYRFLKNPRADLKVDTVQKLARFYEVTESQLRGDMPIEGMQAPPDNHELKDLLKRDEYNHVTNVRHLEEPIREILFRLTEILVEEPKTVYRLPFPERRNSDRFPNNQLRAGEMYNRSAITKRRLKDSSNDDRKTGSIAKKHQAA